MRTWTFTEAWDRCPYRSIITLTDADAPVAGAWAIVHGPALPVPDRVFEDAANAFRAGGAFLILANTKADRDAAKAALLLRFNRPEGRA